MRVLRVTAAPGLKVTELRALNSKPTGFHRWMDPDQVYEYSSDSDEPETITTLTKALKKGDVLPADAATARLAGIPFKAPKASKAEG